MMTHTTATPPAPLGWDEARALASAIALTASFTVVYVVIAPLVLLGALAGGPLWATIVLVRERALGA
jgi:hypothetical protein